SNGWRKLLLYVNEHFQGPITRPGAKRARPYPAAALGSNGTIPETHDFWKRDAWRTPVSEIPTICSSESTLRKQKATDHIGSFHTRKLATFISGDTSEFSGD